MTKLRLFEYAVILQPKTDKDGEVVEDGSVLVPVTNVLAQNEGQVNLIAARLIPEDKIEAIDRIEVVVRPF